MTLAEAAAAGRRARRAGSERELATLRSQWDEELEAAARSQDFRERAVAYRAIAQFRFRQKIELLRRGLEDESPACRGSAVLCRSSGSRATIRVSSTRPGRCCTSSSTHDGNEAVRRLAIMALKNGSPQPDTIRILTSLAEDDEQNRELRDAAAKVAQALRRKAGPSKKAASSPSASARAGAPGSTTRAGGRSDTCV